MKAVRCGARARVSPHRHRAGVRKRGERRPGAAGERPRARRGVHHDEVPSRAARPAREIARSIERLGVDYVDLYLVHWPQGGATWAWPGMERPASAATPGRSASRTSAPASSTQVHRRWRPSPPVVDQVQFNPSPTARRCSTPAPSAVSRSRPTARWAPAHSWRSDGGAIAAGSAERRPRCSCAGASSAASRSSQVDPSRPHRGERPVFDFALSAGTWRSSTRSTAQDGPRPHSSANGGRAERSPRLDAARGPADRGGDKADLPSAVEQSSGEAVESICPASARRVRSNRAWPGVRCSRWLASSHGRGR